MFAPLSRPLRHLVPAGFCLLALAAEPLAGTYDLAIGSTTIKADGRTKRVIAYNGQFPGPTLRFTEGEDITINVTNTLEDSSSIHWHGLILPYTQDGVPGFGYDGIDPGETFTYRFPVVQSGTYWYHSHSGMQEQDGAYGSIVIEPARRDPFRFDREYVLVLSDLHDHAGDRIWRNLKKMSDYYNRQQRTLSEFIADASRMGFGGALEDRMMWGEMRMMPTDIADVQGYTFLVNGKDPEQNWTAPFEPGERVRLRLINASAMTYFDVRIPGLEMTVVQADGNNVQPVTVEELRIAVAETYDVIVRPTEARDYSLLAESMARTGFARATLMAAGEPAAPLPALRQPPLLTMADMAGHGGHGGMDHIGMTGMDHGQMPVSEPASMEDMDQSQMDHAQMQANEPAPMDGMDHSQMDHAQMDHSQMPAAEQAPTAAMDHSQMGHAMDSASNGKPSFYAAGSGLTPAAADGGKFLSYGDLKALRPLYEPREPDREMTIRLTGNMERYIWSMDDKKYSEAEPIRFKYGERVRITLVNETMMSHPMHLHGMWSLLDNGNGRFNPAKHVLNVAPATSVTFDVEVDAEGEWPFHCHLMYHMASGMFRKVIVERELAESAR